MRATQRLLDFALYVAVFFSLLTDWIAFSPEQMENANHIVGDAVAVYTRLLASAVQSVVKNSDATHRVKTITDRIIE